MSYLATKEIRKTIWNHIRESANEEGIRVDYINGYSDHYRCLIGLDQGQSIEKMMKVLNGEKTLWINKKGLSTEFFPSELPPILNANTTDKLDWKEDFFTIVIDESGNESVNSYIQESNLKKNNSGKISANKVFDEFLIEYKFQKFIEK